MCNQPFKKSHAIDALWKALSTHIPSVSRKQYKSLVLFIQIKSHIMGLLLPTPAQTIDFYQLWNVWSLSKSDSRSEDLTCVILVKLHIKYNREHVSVDLI